MRRIWAFTLALLLAGCASEPLVEAAEYLDVHKWMADLRERLNVEVADYL